MLNSEDCAAFDKLLSIIKSSNEYNAVDFCYSKEEGWRIAVYPVSYSFSNVEHDNWRYKKERLGDTCMKKIAWIVQQRLEGNNV
jgi:hypothetical protein